MSTRSGSLPKKVDTEYEDKLIVRNKSTRNFETKSKELSLIINEI